MNPWIRGEEKISIKKRNECFDDWWHIKSQLPIRDTDLIDRMVCGFSIENTLSKGKSIFYL